MRRKRNREQEAIDWCTQRCMSIDKLDKVAAGVRDAYCQRRRSYADGYAPGPKYQADWRAAAMCCVAAGVSASVWVDSQFDGNHEIPYPTNLYGAVAEARHLTWKATNCDNAVRNTLYSYLARVEAWQRTTSIDAMLGDEQHGFTALFIWCMAKKHGLQHHVERVQQLARQELQQRSTSAVYAEAFPDEIGELNGRLPANYNQIP
jgi:hypothetical protein